MITLAPTLVRAPLLTMAFMCAASAELGPDPTLQAGSPHPWLYLKDGVTIASLSGSPQAMGEQTIALTGDRVHSLLRTVALRAYPLRLLHPGRLAAQISGIGDRHRAELVALAHALGIDEEEVFAANVLVDSQCSALVSPEGGDQPLRLARNMDFFPASTLGPGTVAMIRRGPGCRAFVSLGWPGFAGVVSGMNDAGLTACVLLNHSGHGQRRGAGQPICFRIRDILEQCGDLEAAVACFFATPVASSHYLLLADAHGAALVWQDRYGRHRDDPRDGWLAAANGGRKAGLPVDRRGCRLMDVARKLQGREVTSADLRAALAETYLPGINAQAMIFTPASCSLDLATGTLFHPAARAVWHHLELRQLLAGGLPSTANIVPITGPAPRESSYLLEVNGQDLNLP